VKRAALRLPTSASASPSSSAPSTWAAVASIPAPFPARTLRESALYFSGLKQRGLYGIDYSLKENLTVHDFMHHEREVVDMERQRILKNLALHKIELIRGQASFEDAHTVIVASLIGTRRLKGEVLLISPPAPSPIAPRRSPSTTFTRSTRTLSCR